MIKNMTDDQRKRTEKMMEGYAKEKISIKVISGILHVYGSELACLRIYLQYKNCDCRVIYSANLETWVFVLEGAIC